MPAEKVLWSYENQAQKNPTPDEGQVIDDGENEDNGGDSFVYTGAGKESGKSKSKLKAGGKLKAFGAVGFIVAMLAIFTGLFSTANILPAAISARLSEETDTQYAYSRETQFLIFQAAMRGQDENGKDTGKGGDLPDNVVEVLKWKGVLVGYPDPDAEGGFVEANNLDSGELSLKVDDKIVSADDFIDEIHENVKLYNAVTEALYSRAGLWYDESANKMFNERGISRDSFTSDSDFDKAMIKEVGTGSAIEIWSSKEDDQGCEKKDTTIDATTELHETICSSSSTHGDKNSGNEDISGFIDAVAEKTKGEDEDTATKNATDAIKATDAVAQEQKAMRYHMAVMQNISKMMAGDGSESKINETMNSLYEKQIYTEYDIETDSVIEIEGSALESPALYSILTGTDYDAANSRNQTSDRVLKLVKKQGGLDEDSFDEEIISGTVSTPSSELKGDIGRFLPNNADEKGDLDLLGTTEPIIAESLVDNSYETITGIGRGNMLVEGAVVTGKELAHLSGGVAGDSEAVASYLKLNTEILALDAASDRMNRSPFDATSKNTFLGSIVYNMAISLYYNNSNSLLSGMVSFIKTTSQSINALLPMAHAEEVSAYLNSHGDCETLDVMVDGAVGSANCVEISVFDTDTIRSDPLRSDSEYAKYLEDNAPNSSVKKDSHLAGFIDNSTRMSPTGITDGGVLDKIVEGGECEDSDTTKKILSGETGRKECEEYEESHEEGKTIGGVVNAIISTIVDLFKTVVQALSKAIAVLIKFSIADDVQKAKATGAFYADTAENRENGNWDNSKWGQFYMSANRNMSIMRQYAVNYDGRLAYDIKGFEWDENPVLAYIRESRAEREEQLARKEEEGLSDVEINVLLSYIMSNPELEEYVNHELAQYGLSLSMIK